MARTRFPLSAALGLSAAPRERVEWGPVAPARAVLVNDWNLVYKTQAQKDAERLAASGLRERGHKLLGWLAGDPYSKTLERVVGDLAGAHSTRINAETPSCVRHPVSEAGAPRPRNFLPFHFPCRGHPAVPG